MPSPVSSAYQTQNWSDNRAAHMRWWTTSPESIFAQILWYEILHFKKNNRKIKKCSNWCCVHARIDKCLRREYVTINLYCFIFFQTKVLYCRCLRKIWPNYFVISLFCMLFLGGKRGEWTRFWSGEFSSFLQRQRQRQRNRHRYRQ